MTSPLTPEERAALRERVDELREDGHKRLPDWVDRLLDERGSLERRAKSAEARLEQAREALADRLADAAIRETDRALREAHEAGRTGVPLTGSDRTWDTCFRATFEPILRAALEPGAGS